jgi:hypothetical protein
MIPSTPSRFVLTVSLLLSFFAFAVADTPIIRMARLSFLEGEVSYQRANQEDKNWYDASTNTPLGENDQVFTGQRGRAEIQLTGRNIVRLDGDTSFKIAQFTTAVTQISLPVGSAIFRVDSLDRRQFDIVSANDANRADPLYFEVNTPTVSVTLLKIGNYRINVQNDGTTEVVVRNGEAEVYNQELGTIVVKKGRRIVIEGNDPGFYQIAKLQDKDAFERWSERRDDELAYQADSLSARYVPSGIPGVYDLDRYGDWWHTADYGYVWSPHSVAMGWSPYRVGAWRWYSDWGWTWISTEPWGWTPYHYGRWAYYRSRWCWVPWGGSGVTVGFSWSPALVTWFGWGNGYNRGYNNGYRDGYRDGRYDSVGWIPLGPGEQFHNPYGRRGNTTIVNNTNIYGNGNTVITQRLDSYRNYNAPGGVTRMDGRRFATHRVAVNNFDNTPLQPPAIRSAVTMRGDSIRPVVTANAQPTVHPAADPRNRPATQRNVVSRGFAHGNDATTPNAMRRGDVVNGMPTLRNSDVPNRVGRPERVGRDANSQNPGPPQASDRANVAPEASRVTTRSAEVNRNNERRFDPEYRRVERNPERPPADRTLRSAEPSSAERTERPTRVAPIWGDNQRQENRRESNPPGYTPRQTERREAPARRVEETPRYEAPRQEAPREDRREERPAPSREIRPERYERPSAPPRQEAPPRVEAPRQSERPSAPPPSRSGGDRTERPTRQPSQQ